MKALLIAALAAFAASPVLASGKVSMDRPEAQTSGMLRVDSTSFKLGQSLATKYSAYGESLSPQLSWTPVPGATSYVVLVDDPDAPGSEPMSHWVDWNIPSDVTSLAEGAKVGVQGTNGHKTTGYTGPHPPAKDPAHHYHFQVLALDATLKIPAAADRDAMLKAAKGHVIAKGETMGTFQAPS